MRGEALRAAPGEHAACRGQATGRGPRHAGATLCLYRGQRARGGHVGSRAGATPSRATTPRPRRGSPHWGGSGAGAGTPRGEGPDRGPPHRGGESVRAQGLRHAGADTPRRGRATLEQGATSGRAPRQGRGPRRAEPRRGGHATLGSRHAGAAGHAGPCTARHGRPRPGRGKQGLGSGKKRGGGRGRGGRWGDGELTAGTRTKRTTRGSAIPGGEGVVEGRERRWATWEREESMGARLSGGGRARGHRVVAAVTTHARSTQGTRGGG
jgi:hypothetical protein